MTSPSRKKRPITARNNFRHSFVVGLWEAVRDRVSRTSALSTSLVLGIGLLNTTYLPAQQVAPPNPFRPQAAAKSIQDSASSANANTTFRSRSTASEGSVTAVVPAGHSAPSEAIPANGLRWRSSSRLSKPVPESPSASTAFRTSEETSTVAAKPVAAQPQRLPASSQPLNRTAINRTGMNRTVMNRTGTNGAIPSQIHNESNAVAPAAFVQPPAAPGSNPTNPVNDPFGDRTSAPTTLPAFPPAAADATKSADEPEPAPVPSIENKIEPAAPEQNTAEPGTVEPSEVGNLPLNIPAEQGTEEPEPAPSILDRSQSPRIIEPSDDESASDGNILPEMPASGLKCDEIREKLRTSTIDKISLDISPRFGRGREDELTANRNREKFLQTTEPRKWYNQQGVLLGEGRLTNITRDRVILDTEGEETSVGVYELSDADLAYLSESWGIPATCGGGYRPFPGRHFSETLFTWKASALCHKPLYFEDVALERYGHSAGPIWQPLASTGHFFTNLAFLPYKVGIHPMGECQYALGYYRPGNCAPWQLPAIPLSGRGALMQAGFVTGAAALLP